MKLIITRHGQTHWNKKDPSIVQGVADIGLSEEGKEQSRKLALALKKYNIENIFVSPLNRALDTAIAIKKYHKNAKVHIEDDLKELDFGVFDGLSINEIKIKYPEIWLAREKDKLNHIIPNSIESFAEAYNRAMRVLNKIIAQGKDSVIVAHGGINKLLFIKLLDTTLGELDKNHYNNTGISVFIIKNGQIQIESYNDSNHL